MSTSDSIPIPAHPFPRRGDPAWDLALMFPLQGSWTAEDYLRLDSGFLIEFSAGFVRVLPMPTISHQMLVLYLFRRLDGFVTTQRLGRVFVAPLPLRLDANRYREPDLLVVSESHLPPGALYPDGAELVIEVVSPDPESHQRDYTEKRFDYSRAGIREYWIVDPNLGQIIVLGLDGDSYREHGIFVKGQLATSLCFPGFEINVDEAFAAAMT